MFNRSFFAKFSLLTLLVVFSTTLVAGPGISQESEVAIKVNDEVVMKSEIQKQVDQTLQRMKQQYGDRMETGNSKMRDRVRQSVVQQQVEQLVLKTNAEKSDVSVTEEEVNRQLESQKKRFNGDEQFQKVLQKQGMSVDDFRKRIRENLLVQKYLDSKIGSVSVTEDEARQYYENNKRKFKGGSFEKVRGSIERILKQRKRQEKRQQLVSDLRESTEVDIRV